MLKKEFKKRNYSKSWKYFEKVESFPSIPEQAEFFNIWMVSVAENKLNLLRAKVLAEIIRGRTRKCISCRKCVRMLKHLWLNLAEYFEKAEHILKKLNIFWKSWTYFEKVENILKKLNIFWKSWKYFEKVEHVLKRLNSLIFERFPQLKCGWRS